MNETPETLSEWLLTQTGDMQVGFDHVDTWNRELDRTLRLLVRIDSLTADRDALRKRLRQIAEMKNEWTEDGSLTVGDAYAMLRLASLPPEFDGAGQSDCCAEENEK